jgi:hypothetical protein
VLRGIFDVGGKKWRETGEDCGMRSSITCTLHQSLSWRSKEEDEISRACSTHEGCEKWRQYLRGKT